MRKFIKSTLLYLTSITYIRTYVQSFPLNTKVERTGQQKSCSCTQKSILGSSLHLGKEKRVRARVASSHACDYIYLREQCVYAVNNTSFLIRRTFQTLAFFRQRLLWSIFILFAGFVHFFLVASKLCRLIFFSLVLTPMTDQRPS